MLESYRRQLIEYEILPNIVWDGMSDDDIREFAKDKISPARPLSKAPDFDYYNKLPQLTVAQCVKLLLNIDANSPIRIQAEKERFDNILAIAASYNGSRQTPFAEEHPDDFVDYLVSTNEFLVWAKAIGEAIPKDWIPVGTTSKNERQTNVQEQYSEMVTGACEMLRNGMVPNSMLDVISTMENDKEKYRACFAKKIKPDSLIKAVSQRGPGNPLKDPSYKDALAQFEADRADRADKQASLPALPLLNNK